MVGDSDLIDFRENERRSYDWTVDRAKADCNLAAIKELDSIVPYPGLGTFEVTKVGIERKWSVHFGAFAAYRDDASFYFDSAQLSSDDWGEIVSFDGRIYSFG